MDRRARAPHAAARTQRPGFSRPVLAAACALTLAGALGAGTVMASAEPVGPAADTASAAVPASPVVPTASAPARTEMPAPTSSTARPTIEPPRSSNPAPAAKSRTLTSTTASTTRTPKVWTPDAAREAERRLDELKNSGPDSALMKCLQSGKLYEQC